MVIDASKMNPPSYLILRSAFLMYWLSFGTAWPVRRNFPGDAVPEMMHSRKPGTVIGKLMVAENFSAPPTVAVISPRSPFLAIGAGKPAFRVALMPDPGTYSIPAVIGSRSSIG